jgi:hypothetical protein
VGHTNRQAIRQPALRSDSRAVKKTACKQARQAEPCPTTENTWSCLVAQAVSPAIRDFFKACSGRGPPAETNWTWPRCWRACPMIGFTEGELYRELSRRRQARRKVHRASRNDAARQGG